IAPRIIDVEGAAAGLPLGAARSICQARDGQIWAAMADGSVMVRRDEKWIPAPFEVNGDAFRVAADPDGAVWVGTRNRRLQRWDTGKVTTWESKDGLTGHTVAALLPTADN